MYVKVTKMGDLVYRGISLSATGKLNGRNITDRVVACTKHQTGKKCVVP